MRKVLYVSHNHPTIRPGGAEIYTAELIRAIRAQGKFEPTLIARVAAAPQGGIAPHEGTRLGLIDSDAAEYYFHTEIGEFDRVISSAYDKRMYTEDWRRFLHAVEPDIVHFQHTLWLGYDVIRETRSALPGVPIVYTLHEFMPICHHGGQMVRTRGRGLCYSASPRDCNECFPAISPQTFFLRERSIKRGFEHVDMFITPSEHARERFIAWGIPPDRIQTENYGRLPMAALPDPPDAGRRRRLGFFGQLGRFKGIDVLLEAMNILRRDGTDVNLHLHGSGLERNPQEFQQRIDQLLDEASDLVAFMGQYEAHELPRLLSAVDWVVVPSIWWETGPLVIQEAMMHRRPVICSNIGSMIEHVEDGLNGLQFRVGDPRSLADTIRVAVEDPELWDTLRSHLKDPYPMEAHLSTITSIYEKLLTRRSRRRTVVA